MKKLTCSKCQCTVGNFEVPENAVIRAWIECPECTEKEIEEETRTHLLVSACTTYTFKCGACSKIFKDEGFEQTNDSFKPEPVDFQKCPHCDAELDVTDEEDED